MGPSHVPEVSLSRQYAAGALVKEGDVILVIDLVP
jgi:hypothetical protein